MGVPYSNCGAWFREAIWGGQGDVALPDTVQLRPNSCRETVKTCAITHLTIKMQDLWLLQRE